MKIPDERLIFGETNTSAFATDGHWKYIYYLDGGVEHLFNVLEDTDDLNNLAQQGIYTLHLERLREALRQYLLKNQRPILDGNGEFKRISTTIDVNQLRATNNAAWRGPLRYGQGYG